MVKGTIGTAVAVVDTETVVGGEVSVRDFDTIALFVDYTKGTETGLIIKVYGLSEIGGDEHQLGGYLRAGGVMTADPREAQFTSSGKKVPLVYDVTGVDRIKVYQLKIGGTASGSFDLDYYKTNK